ncbi:unnamed protein product [Amoebophrya sp. A120]|nr:unnamed protein product [Amoebophrya sp. A120]|eukprot:GSA120T00023058001.1
MADNGGFYVGDGDESPGSKRRKMTASASTLGPQDVDFAHQNKWINDWEKNFYTENMTKESLSEKQTSIKDQIEKKVAECFANKGRLDEAKTSGIITQWEYDFSVSNLARDPEKLSEKQQAQKAKIDAKLGGSGMASSSSGAASAFAAPPMSGFSAAPAMQQQGFGQFGQIGQAQTFGQFGQPGSFGQPQQQPHNFGMQQPGGFGATNFAPPQHGGGFNYMGGGVGVAQPGAVPAGFLNMEQITQAKQENKISDWEVKFYSDQLEKLAADPDAHFTDKQVARRTEIEEKVRGGKTTEIGDDEYSELWGLHKTEIDDALKEQKIVEWDYNFILNNFARAPTDVTEKQAPVVEKIKNKLNGEAPAPGDAGPGAAAMGGGGVSPAWGMTEEQMVQARDGGRINDWEFNFMKSNFDRNSFSEKQQTIVDRIQGKLQGGGQGGRSSNGGPAAGGFGQQYFANRQGQQQRAAAPGGGGGGMLTQEEVQAAYQAKKINDWEYNFYTDNLQKSYHSDKQKNIMAKVEQKARK